jgi:hypothetical protein
VLICAALWTQAWKLKCVSEWAPEDVRQWLISENADWEPHWDKLAKPNGKTVAMLKEVTMKSALGEVVGEQVFNAVELLLDERKDQLGGKKFDLFMKKRGEYPHPDCCDWSHACVARLRRLSQHLATPPTRSPSRRASPYNVD